MFIALKPLEERKINADQVIARLRGKLAKVPGATLFLQSFQDIRVGGHASNSQYQYTIQADTLTDLNTWAPRMLTKLRTMPDLRDVNTDQQMNGLQIVNRCRSRYRRAARRLAANHRQYSLRCVWATAGLHHL